MGQHNYYHLLIEISSETLSKFMREFNINYTSTRILSRYDS
ncbi:hypothetical protein MNB_SV-6-1189 [hydrothermal vent metagenome]|uniref:Uncharacterized protein n=1 Tax=hydrothermal vent metagenome TaxID=652676 RepID=A0A1W1BFE1_9ZZZZ